MDLECYLGGVARGLVCELGVCACLPLLRVDENALFPRERANRLNLRD